VNLGINKHAVHALALYVLSHSVSWGCLWARERSVLPYGSVRLGNEFTPLFFTVIGLRSLDVTVMGNAYLKGVLCGLLTHLSAQTSSSVRSGVFWSIGAVLLQMLFLLINEMSAIK